ncbi:MAG: hypothetical protein COA74_14645 [Gammaproteobacteria bacterium]|nr:MAG: hypothetical protein COA74_14645 [Gammaproteobacteria bacterium]
MNGENPLQNLRDIHLPDSVSFWPPAPGWWILAFLVLSLICWLIWKVWEKYQQKHLLRLSMAKLEQLNVAFEEHQDARQLIGQYSSLLRRVSMALFSRSEVASLTGNSWLNFLDNRANTNLFASDAGYLLLNAPYQRPEKTIEHLDQLSLAVKIWIKAAHTASLVGAKND